MHFESFQNDINSSFMVNSSDNFYSLNSNIDNNTNTFFDLSQYPPKNFPFHFDGENKSTTGEDFSHIKSVFPAFIDSYELSSNKSELDDFDVIYTNKIFSINLSQEKTKEYNIKNITPIFEIIKTEKTVKSKKDKTSRERYKKKDNILSKLGRNFFNKYLVEKITGIIQKFGSKLYFNKFPQNFVLKAVLQKNKKIWNMKLIEIFVEKELYTKDDKINYARNKNVIDRLNSAKNKNILEDSGLNIILNMKISDIYNKYLTSNEYEKKIKSFEKKYDKDYIESFKRCAEEFVKNFTE